MRAYMERNRTDWLLFVLVSVGLLTAALGCGEGAKADGSANTWADDAGAELDDAEVDDAAVVDADAGAADDADVQGSSPDASDGGQGRPDAQALADVSGTWAQRLHVSSISDVPLVGEVNSTTISTLRLSVEQSGADLSVTTETCDVEIVSSADLVETIIPDAFVDALEVSVRSGTVQGAGEQAHIVLPRFVELRGVRLDDIESDPLPTDPDDSRIWDQDEDGHPGMTVRVGGGLVDGEIYLIQRGWNALEGDVVDDQYVDGLVDWGDEQVVLGSDNQLLEEQPDSRPDPEAENSFFRSTRVADSVDCDGILADADALFAR
jgi:hypothetical protein